MPPSLKELERRLKTRKTDSEKMIKNRLEIAVKEISMSDMYDYIITNNKIDVAVEKLKMIIDNEK